MILLDRHKKMLLDLIEKYLPTHIDIIVYGSRADGTAHDMSDLDLALHSKDDKPINSDILFSFKTAVRKSNLPMLVDIFDWHR
ncbi:MAG: nucleotidyltransferase domain-containing protein [Bacteroidota bacterium]